MRNSIIPILSLFVTVTLSLSACVTDEGEEAAEYGIHWTGQESDINGTWSGTLSGFMKFTIRLDDGEVIESWLSAAGMSFHTYQEDGNIGYYSFDGTKFEAVLFDDIESLSGRLSDGTLNGKDADGDNFVLSK